MFLYFKIFITVALKFRIRNQASGKFFQPDLINIFVFREFKWKEKMGDHEKSDKDDTQTSKSERTTKDESGDEAEPTIAQDIVVTKYNMAAEIVNGILKEIVGKCQVGQSVGELCDYGDQQLGERANKVSFLSILGVFFCFGSQLRFFLFILYLFLTVFYFQVFRKEKEMKKGVAFPTCISVNNCVCHFSPLRSESDLKLADGDVVKIDLGVHIDGFIAVGAHTLVVGASKDKKVTKNRFLFLLLLIEYFLGYRS